MKLVLDVARVAVSIVVAVAWRVSMLKISCRLGYALALHCSSAAPSMSMSMSTSTSIGLYDPNVYGGECGKKFYACQPYSH